MTKTDFEAIAHVLDANVTPLYIVQDMADMLEESNPRFNRVLFVQASTKLLREANARELRMLNHATTPKEN